MNFIKHGSGALLSRRSNLVRCFIIFIRIKLTTMKPYLYTIFLFVFANIINPLCAQDFWESVPLPDTVDVTCFAMNDQSEIFIGSGISNEKGGLYRSSDNGVTWNLVFNSGNFAVLSISINDQDVIYMGTFKNDLWYSTDNGESWTEILSTPFYRIFNSWPKGDTVYISTDNHQSHPFLYKTWNNGANWDSLFYLPDGTSVIRDMLILEDGKMYICTDGFFQGMGGVYYSDDYGETWEFDGLPSLMVEDLDITSTGDIIAIAYGETGGSLGPGFYIKDHESGLWELLASGYGITGGLCTDEDHFYFLSTMPYGIYRSLDYGETFTLIMDGYPVYGGGDKIKLGLDGHIYTYRPNLIRSIESTSVGDYEISRSENNIVTIFPNPAHNSFSIASDISEFKYQIYNTSMTLAVEGQSFDNQIDISEIDTGLYFLILKHKTEPERFAKFVKM